MPLKRSLFWRRSNLVKKIRTYHQMFPPGFPQYISMAFLWPSYFVGSWNFLRPTDHHNIQALDCQQLGPATRVPLKSDSLSEGPTCSSREVLTGGFHPRNMSFQPSNNPNQKENMFQDLHAHCVYDSRPTCLSKLSKRSLASSHHQPATNMKHQQPSSVNPHGCGSIARTSGCYPLL